MIFQLAMKRLILITCSFLVVFSGAIAAWESCNRVSFASESDHDSSVPVHGHHHDSGSEHHHSDNGLIHCPPLDGYLPTAIFSLNKDHRIERVLATFVAGFDTPVRRIGSYGLIHGPPGFLHSNIIPQYLLLSVLRI
jgi:hypothetical protein